MREIKFRGKSIETGEWVYGSLNTHYDSGKGNVTIWEDYNDFENVDPETVGQFAGLTDKNGVGIYEDDVLETDMGLVEVIWDDISFQGRQILTNNIFPFYIIGGSIEKRGNRHDNSELLNK